MDNNKIRLTLLQRCWYLFRAKSRNDSNFMVGDRPIGRGRGVEERMEVAVVSSGSGRRWWRQESGYTPCLKN